MLESSSDDMMNLRKIFLELRFRTWFVVATTCPTHARTQPQFLLPGRAMGVTPLPFFAGRCVRATLRPLLLQTAENADLECCIGENDK